EPTSGLGGDQHLRVPGDLAGDDHLLLVPAGEGARARVRAAAADVEVVDQPGGARDQAARIEPAEPRGGRRAVVVNRDVLGDRELEDEAAAVAVLGDVPDARVEHPPGGAVRVGL